MKLKNILITLEEAGLKISMSDHRIDITAGDEVNVEVHNQLIAANAVEWASYLFKNDSRQMFMTRLVAALGLDSEIEIETPAFEFIKSNDKTESKKARFNRTVSNANMTREEAIMFAIADLDMSKAGATTYWRNYSNRV